MESILEKIPKIWLGLLVSISGTITACLLLDKLMLARLGLPPAFHECRNSAQHDTSWTPPPSKYGKSRFIGIGT